MYTVTVGRHPGCTCPDAQKGHVCKHYLFVQARERRFAASPDFLPNHEWPPMRHEKADALVPACSCSFRLLAFPEPFLCGHPFAAPVCNLPYHALPAVQLRVLRLPRDDPLVWQTALLPSEADEVSCTLLLLLFFSSLFWNLQHRCRARGPGLAGKTLCPAWHAWAARCSLQFERQRYTVSCHCCIGPMQFCMLCSLLQVLSGQHSCRGPVAGGGGDAVLAPDAVRQQYERLTGAELESAKAGASQPGGQRPIEPDEDCPICFDELAPTAGAAGEAISWCTACGKSAHSACMQKWVRSKLAAGHEVTCPLCRAPFKDGAGKVSAGGGAAGPAPAGGSPGQFLNLGQYSEAHRGGASLEELYGAESAYWIGRRSRGGW